MKGYTLDKTRRLSFRLNEKLADWLEERAKISGVTACEYARSVLFSQMAAEQTTIALLKKVDAVAGDAKHENIAKH